MVTGLRTVAFSAAFFAASASSIRFKRPSFWALSLAAVASPGSRKLGFVGALTGFGGGGILMGRALGFGAPSASLFRRSSFWALSFAETASPGSWKLDFVAGLIERGGGGILIGRCFGAVTPSASRFKRSSFWALSFAATESLDN